MRTGICKEIGDQLMGNKLNNPGLFYGNMGVSIFMYHLAGRLSDEKYAAYANELMDDIFQKIIPNPNFRNGMAGIGWGIEYLIQNDFCEGTSDEILEDIDTEIFKVLNIEDKRNPLDLQNGLLGYLQYLIIRLKNSKSQGNSTRINTELLKVLIHQIDQVAPERFISLARDIRFDLLDDVYLLLWSFNSAFHLNIYNDKIFNMLKQWEVYWISYFPGLHFNRLRLAYILLKNNQILKSQNTERHIRTLLYSIDIDRLMSEIDFNMINSVRLGYLGQLLVLNSCIDSFDLTYPNYTSLISLKPEACNLCNHKLLARLDNLSEGKKGSMEVECGMADGWAGVGLLLLLKPDMISS